MGCGSPGSGACGSRRWRPKCDQKTPLTSKRAGQRPMVVSRPVRRILSRSRSSRGGHPSRPAVARRLQRPTRGSWSGGQPSPCLALLRVGFTEPPGSPRALVRSYRTVAPLPVRHPRGRVAIGGLLSVALSCGSPRLGVTQHLALWSPDVPRAGQAGTRPPGRLTTTRHPIGGGGAARLSALRSRKRATSPSGLFPRSRGVPHTPAVTAAVAP
jgi:hypothetical protein